MVTLRLHTGGECPFYADAHLQCSGAQTSSQRPYMFKAKKKYMHNIIFVFWGAPLITCGKGGFSEIILWGCPSGGPS